MCLFFSSIDCSVKQDEEVNPNLSGLSERTYSEVLMAANKATDLNLESIHIKEERLSNSIQTNPSIQAVQTGKKNGQNAHLLFNDVNL